MIIIQEERKLGHNILANSLEKFQLKKSPNILCLRAEKVKMDYPLCQRANVQLHN